MKSKSSTTQLLEFHYLRKIKLKAHYITIDVTFDSIFPQKLRETRRFFQSFFFRSNRKSSRIVIYAPNQ